MTSFRSEASRQALRDAVEAIETRSAVEVVVTVRAEARSYLAADLTVGGIAAVATLAVLLWAPTPFALLAFVIDPLLVGVLAALASRVSPGLRRLLTGRERRRDAVEQAARALFVAKRVHATRERTGLLVHVALLEGLVHLVPDLGIEQAVPPEDLEQAQRRLEAALARDPGGGAFAEALASLAGVFARDLPRRPDDVNELPDEACVP